jgi:hypothetical protein
MLSILVMILLSLFLVSCILRIKYDIQRLRRLRLDVREPFSGIGTAKSRNLLAKLRRRGANQRLETRRSIRTPLSLQEIEQARQDSINKQKAYSQQRKRRLFP